MRSRIKLIGVPLVAVIVCAVVAAMAVIPRVVDNPMTLTAHFEDAVGLYVGNGVSVLGMQVGKVTAIDAKDGYVQVTLAIDRGVDIPADVQAVTVSDSILTDRHVELTPPYRDGAKLRTGDVLGPGRTRTPVEFDRTLSMIDKLGKALRGDDKGSGPLGDLVNLGAQVTVGNGTDIKATLDKLSQALRVGSDKGARSKKNIQAIISSVSELSQAAADNDAAIREFGSQLRQLSDILAEEDLGSGDTGAKLNQILAEVTRLLQGHRDGLKDTFADTRAITTTLTDRRRELEELIDVGPLTVDNIYNIVDETAGSLRVHGVIDKVIFNSQFGKEICNLMGLKQLGCATGTLQDYGPDFGLTGMLDLMANGISGTP
ncbi:MCE family protein [Mycolicibacter kumamotonensis]|uniref:Mammalian cell entry protein n=1 Tax=Mycolicibacter kumamotonensis TaxID=354243 RepID=A0A1B8SI48_9MYCO|nr:MCE family protein [Mycolicibacter kumamotonensis]OBY32374.1 mammalian cell entry protein [Mycolicibacter kumamotonensis]